MAVAVAPQSQGPLRRDPGRAPAAAPGGRCVGVVWIVICGALLAGIVAVNVAVLRLNISLDKTGRERTQIRADIQSLSSQVSSAQAAGRIQAQAQHDLGVVPADANNTTFITLPAR